MKESGAWMNALPISPSGLRLDDDVIKIAVGLCLGTLLCHPHQCHLCGAHVDAFGTNCLSCVKSQGKYPSHAAINRIIHGFLMAAMIPSTSKPLGLSRSDGKHLDRATIAPCEAEHTLVWDVTCRDTMPFLMWKGY